LSVHIHFTSHLTHNGASGSSGARATRKSPRATPHSAVQNLVGHRIYLATVIGVPQLQ
jgi:hypothetical protein